eukprot:763528-Hanusia_phi.AAC.1
MQLNEFDYRRGDVAADSQDVTDPSSHALADSSLQFRLANRLGLQEGMQVIVAQTETAPAMSKARSETAAEQTSREEDEDEEVRRVEGSDPVAQEDSAVQTPSSFSMEESIFSLKSPSAKRAPSADAGGEQGAGASGEGKEKDLSALLSGHAETWDSEADKLRSILSETGEEGNKAVPDFKSAIQLAVQQVATALPTCSDDVVVGVGGGGGEDGG